MKKLNTFRVPYNRKCKGTQALPEAKGPMKQMLQLTKAISFKE